MSESNPLTKTKGAYSVIEDRNNLDIQDIIDEEENEKLGIEEEYLVNDAIPARKVRRTKHVNSSYRYFCHDENTLRMLFDLKPQ
jgi:hypothetical protein